MESLSVAATLDQACKIRHVLKPYLEAFQPLFTQRRATGEKLAPLLTAAGKSILKAPASKPLLQENMPEGLGQFIVMAAQDLLPLLLAQKALAPHKAALEMLFISPVNEHDREVLLEAMIQEDGAGLISLAHKSGMPPEILQFASEFIIGAVLRGLASGRGDDTFPEWRRGVCPVCGSAPIIAWLGKRPISAGNEFLVDGGGRKHLHCGLCGSNWHFVRGICPSCGGQGEDAMQILGEEDRRHERIDWCKKCQTYLPLVDLRELADAPDMDAMALALMHLDIVAAKKDLVPLKPSFWNMF